MLAILYALATFVADLCKSRSRLEAENLFLRYQLNLALQQKPPRIRLRGSDRALPVWMVDCGRACLTQSRSFSPRQFFGGIALELGASGGGNLGIGRGGRGSIASFAN
jgi:hypothetical protein